MSITNCTTKRIRFVATAKRGNTNLIQLSRVRFFNGATQVHAISVTNPGGTNPPGEGPEQLLDTNPRTKWLNSNSRPILVFDFGAEPVTINAYALTPANDCKERDPVAWRLEAERPDSAGGGWVVVDERLDIAANKEALPEFRMCESEFFFLRPSPEAVADAAAAAATKATTGGAKDANASNAPAGGVLALQVAKHVSPGEAPSAANFRIGTVPTTSLDPRSELKDGQVHLKLTHISMDPWYLGMIKPGLYSWLSPTPVGNGLWGTAVATVTQSRFKDLQVGDVVSGFLPLQTEARVDGATSGLANIGQTKPADALSVFGGPALTAFFGLKDVAAPKTGEVVCVSAAAGSVGSIVGQLCKDRGCHVIGFAGSDAKCAVLTNELGFDAAINYKNPGLPQALAAALKGLAGGSESNAEAKAPRVDVYWDNTGGVIAEAVYDQMADHGRVVVCGEIASYVKGGKKGDLEHRNHIVMERRLRVEGILVSEYFARIQEAMPTLVKLHAEGKLKARSHVVHGFQNTISAFLGLFEGANTGKTVVEV